MERWWRNEEADGGRDEWRDKGRDEKMDEVIVERSEEGDLEGRWRDIEREGRETKGKIVERWM